RVPGRRGPQAARANPSARLSDQVQRIREAGVAHAGAGTRRAHRRGLDRTRLFAVRHRKAARQPSRAMTTASSDRTDGFLGGIRVVELADELGEYGGKVLAGLGADV